MMMTIICAGLVISTRPVVQVVVARDTKNLMMSTSHSSIIRIMAAEVAVANVIQVITGIIIL